MDASREARGAKAEEQWTMGRSMLARPAAPRVTTNLRAVRRLFEASGDGFRAACRWPRAAEAYVQAADCELRLDRPEAAASFLADAGFAALHADPSAACGYFSRATERFVLCGRSRAAAALQLRVADVHESDLALEDAAAAACLAADCFQRDLDLPSTCWAAHRAGELRVRAGDFASARACFDRAARTARDHNLLKFRCPSLLLDVALCALASADLVDTAAAVEAAAKEDAVFATGRERRFMLDLIDAARGYDPDAFMDHCWNFDAARLLSPAELR